MLKQLFTALAFTLALMPMSANACEECEELLAAAEDIVWQMESLLDDVSGYADSASMNSDDA